MTYRAFMRTVTILCVSLCAAAMTPAAEGNAQPKVDDESVVIHPKSDPSKCLQADNYTDKVNVASCDPVNSRQRWIFKNGMIQLESPKSCLYGEPGTGLLRLDKGCNTEMSAFRWQWNDRLHPNKISGPAGCVHSNPSSPLDINPSCIGGDDEEWSIGRIAASYPNDAKAVSRTNAKVQVAYLCNFPGQHNVHIRLEQKLDNGGLLYKEGTAPVKCTTGNRFQYVDLNLRPDDAPHRAWKVGYPAHITTYVAGESIPKVVGSNTLTLRQAF